MWAIPSVYNRISTASEQVMMIQFPCRFHLIAVFGGSEPISSEQRVNIVHNCEVIFLFLPFTSGLKQTTKRVGSCLGHEALFGFSSFCSELEVVLC